MSGELPVTVTQCNNTGATLSQLKKYFEDWAPNQAKRDSKLTTQVLENQDNAVIYHQHMETPFIINDKEFIATSYLHMIN